MEWVETTAKTIDEAKEAALDELGVAAEDAEFEILEAPRPGLFGRLRGEARVRTRVRPAEVRPKNDRRRKSERSGRPRQQRSGASEGSATEAQPAPKKSSPRRQETSRAPAARPQPTATDDTSDDSFDSSTPAVEVSPGEVGAAAVDFVEGLVKAFGLNGSAELAVDGIELDVSVEGNELGVLIGPGGRTLVAVQNLTRVAAQRRLGDHETRLRVDVAGYREKRTAALQEFVRRIADEVRESGQPRLLEPMTSTDRKIAHDVLNEIEGVGSRSEGDDPERRVVVVPAP